MSALFNFRNSPKSSDSQEAFFRPMALEHLGVVAHVEQSVYPFPWSLGNFSDSLQSGYHMQMLMGGQAETTSTPVLIGYFVAMKGVDETHLLNITVAPAYQRQGWGRLMLDALTLWSRGQGAQQLWLEVRPTNARAKAVYARHGFREIGVRKGYYPNSGSGLPVLPVLPGVPEVIQREDAVVMSLALNGLNPPSGLPDGARP